MYQAHRLRKSGESIKTIAKKLAVSQSTVSCWCKNLSLTPEQSARLKKRGKEAGRRALAPWIEKRKNMKIVDLRKQSGLGKADVGSLSPRDRFMVGLGLYWGEGYKRGSQECGFTNSDPLILETFVKWLAEQYQVHRNELIARVTINNRYQDQSDSIHIWWQRKLKIKALQFSRPSFISSGSKISTRDPKTYKGTLRLKVRKGTSLRRRILASIAALS